MKKQLFYLLLSSCILLIACFHKSPESAQADDVVQVLICETGTGSYLVCKEEIFQASSKSSGPKGSYISGYKQYRYSVRAARSGKLLVRLVSKPDEDFNILGFDGQRLWCCSANAKIGLHARSPLSLKIVLNSSRITALNPVIGQMPTIPLEEAHRFFQYDNERGSILLLNNSAFVFRLNLKTLLAESEKTMPVNLNPIIYPLSNTVYLGYERRVSLSPEIRNYFTKESGKVHSFLMGKLLVESDRQKIATFKHTIFKKMAKVTLGDSSRLLPSLSSVTLGTDSDAVYIMEATNLEDSAHICLSAYYVSANDYKKKWSSTVGGIYYNYRAAIKTNPKAMVFSSGNPDYDYEWFGLTKGVLVGVRMLYMFGLDANSGKLLWKVKI